MEPKLEEGNRDIMETLLVEWTRWCSLNILSEYYGRIVVGAYSLVLFMTQQIIILQGIEEVKKETNGILLRLCCKWWK